jgi:hypothetical protein
MLIPDAGTSKNGVNNALKFVKENEGKDWIIAGDSLAGMPEYLSNENGLFASKMILPPRGMSVTIEILHSSSFGKTAQ